MSSPITPQEIRIGTKVRFTYGSEAWTYSRNKEKIWTVTDIRVVLNAAGRFHNLFMRLAGRVDEIGVADVEVVSEPEIRRPKVERDQNGFPLNSTPIGQRKGDAA